MGRRGSLTIRLLLVAAGLGLACGEAETPDSGSPEGGADTRETVALAEPRAGDADGGDSDAQEFRCPDGTEPVEIEIPETATRLRSCEKRSSDGRPVRHGPYDMRRGGRIVEKGRFLEGRRHGRWTFHWASGPPQSSGEYRYGRRSGSWTTWATDGSELRRVDYGEAGETEPAPAEAAPRPAAPAGTTVRVGNAEDDALVVVLEPSRETLVLAPGASVRVRAKGVGADTIVVESREDGLHLFAGEEASPESFEEPR